MSYLILSSKSLCHAALARQKISSLFTHQSGRFIWLKHQTSRSSMFQHQALGIGTHQIIENLHGHHAVKHYTTSVKPHMTKSLRKWKKQKRKSKAQQLKELENLQSDLVKLLSKRAIQVVKDKSMMGAQREFVTRNAFSQPGMHDQESRVGLPVSILADSSDRGRWSDEVAQAVEIKFGLSQHKWAYQQFSTKDRAFFTNTEKLSDHNIVQSFETKKTQTISLGDNLHKIFAKPISYSDVFHTPSRSGNRHSSLSTVNTTPNFESAVKAFLSELNSVNPETISDMLPEWCLDSQTSNVNDDLTNSVSDLTSNHIPSINDLGSLKLKINTSASSNTADVSTSKTNTQSTDTQPFFHNTPHASSSNTTSTSTLTADNNKPKQSLHRPIKDPTQVVFQAFPDPSHKQIQEQGIIPSGMLNHNSMLSQHLPASLFIHEPVNIADEVLIDHHQPKKKSGRGKSKHTASSTSFDSMVVGLEIKEMLDRSFVEVSCFTDCELLAVRNLQYHATKTRITSVKVFDTLMRALAKKGELNLIKSLFLLLRQQGLKPTLQTYAACLECFGRMPEVDVQLVANLLSDISKTDLDIGDIARKCSYEKDEFDFVLQAIRRVQPDFTPNPLTFPTKYTNDLLLAINQPNPKMNELNQYAIDMSPDEMMRRAKLQLDMEVKGDVKVKSIAAGYAPAIKPKVRELRNELLADWRRGLLDSFDKKLAHYERSAQDNVNMTLYPFLKLFPREEYVNIIFRCLKELLTLSTGYSPTLTFIKQNLGQAVNRKYNTALRVAAEMDKKVLTVYERYVEEFLNSEKRLDNHRLMWLRAMGQNWDTQNMDLSLKRWPGHILREVGDFLLDMILYDLKVDANTFKKKSIKRMVPAFCTMTMSDRSRYTTAELKLHPVVSRLFAVDDSEYFTFAPSVVPMVVPPVPWISRNTGSLMLGSSALVRQRPSLGHVDPLKWTRESRFSSVLDSLNTLSACAWQINKPILDLQIEVFNNKGDENLKIAVPASECPPLPVIGKDVTPKEKADLYKERLALQQQRDDAHGLWCTDLYRFSIANKFRDETFWFPHSMDFRGRTYPLPPHFNHLGSDNVRGMLLFAKGKPLGMDGYDWLKIHLINLTGLRKRSSNTERLEFADSVMDDILDSADNPLTGRKWWQGSDEPWQTLACCMEVAKIERFQGRKDEYVCHVPIHQDGSCNGLQHYAAIGRDQYGAESVNLYPYDEPKDVYSDVVDLVEKTRQRHAEQGKEIAQILEGFIKRKVIKQTIMTTVYGVTKYGAHEQIHRQLKDIPNFPEEHAWRGSMYLTQTTFECLREMFAAARDIQDWLTEASALISLFAPIDWVTPLGFPVLQPYFKRVGKNSQTLDRFKPNTMKQKNAFPPNYIHSLDSTHMMLTALYSMHAGITFVSVHDCYWTHACDVTTMNRICREQFVNMHKQPLLEDLSEHLVDLVIRSSKDPNLVEIVKKVDVPALLKLLRNVPKRGKFNLNKVLKSTYFFS